MNTIEFIPLIGKNHEGKRVRGVCVPSKYLFRFGKDIKKLQYKNMNGEYYNIYDTLIYNFDCPYNYFILDYIIEEKCIQIVVADDYTILEEYNEGLKIPLQESTVDDLLTWLDCDKGVMKWL